MDHYKIHFTAVTAAKAHRKTEIELLNALELVRKNKTFSRYGCRSLFEYSTKHLKLSEEMASIVNKIAKKFTELTEPKLKMEAEDLSLSKVNRITAVVNKENVEHWTNVAKGTKRNLEKEIAKVQPEKTIPDRARYQKAGDTLRVTMSYSMTQEEFAIFERTQDLLSQKLKRPATLGDVHIATIKELCEELDPLKKPVREKSAGTTKLTLTLKLKLHHNHNSQCTYIDESGQRCHLDIHDILPRSQGGTHSEDNLTLLCSGHHRAHHRKQRNESGRW